MNKFGKNRELKLQQKDIQIRLEKAVQELSEAEETKDEKTAIVSAISGATAGSFITLLSDKIPEAIEIIRSFKDKEGKVTVLKADIPNQG